MPSYPTQSIRRAIVLCCMCMAALVMSVLPAQAVSRTISGVSEFSAPAPFSPPFVPFTAFGGLNVTGGPPLEFTVTYEDTTPDSAAGPTFGDYFGITQVHLSVGSSSVSLQPTTGFDATNSLIEIVNDSSSPGDLLEDSLGIHVMGVSDTDGNRSRFSMLLLGPEHVFRNDALNPIGGVDSLNFSDFYTNVFVGAGVGIEGPTKNVFASYTPTTVTFPNSSSNSAPIPEPSTVLLLGSGLLGLAGHRWWRRTKA